jgi:UDP-4-amino-4,6-dideoxy-N-acetyl-beta-L-altrosamine transaminase
MTKRFLPYGRQWITEEDIQAVCDVLRGDWLTTGPTVQAFEAALAAQTRAPHMVVVNSGTAALHTAYAAAGLKPGDEVVTTPLTFAATANAALYVGATLRFVDVEADTGLIDPDAVNEAVTANTRVVVAVDYTGQPADYDALRRTTDRIGAQLIADAAHSLGATDQGRPVGTLADATTFSFHPVKPITTGEGGAIACHDAQMAATMRDFRTHGLVRDPVRHTHTDGGAWHQEMQTLGYNYRLTDLQCALGLSQLTRLDALIARRGEIACKYHGGLADIDGIELPVVRNNVTSGWHLYVIRVSDDGAQRQRLFDKLRALGVGVQVHYEPVHHHPYYRSLGFDPDACPNAIDFASRAISLPIFPAMTNDDILWVVEQVRTAVHETR